MATNKLEKYDFIIDATADLSGGRHLNKALHDSGLPVIFTWLEPFGIGGHAVLTGIEGPGCLECFIADHVNGPYVTRHFLEPHQVTVRDLTGCGGVFTPFSQIDSIKTATLAVEMLLDYLLKEDETRYRCWKGSPDSAVAEGLKIREEFYSLDPTERYDILKEKPHLTCRLCRRRGGTTQISDKKRRFDVLVGRGDGEVFFFPSNRPSSYGGRRPAHRPQDAFRGTFAH